MTPSSPSDAPIRPAPRLVLWALRYGSLLVVLLVLIQGALAGSFVTGDLDMLRLHSLNSNVAFFAQVVVVLGAVGLWWRGRGPQWPLWTALALQVAIGVQIASGHRRLIEIHLPLALLIFAVSVVFAMVMMLPRWRTGARGSEAEADAGADALEADPAMAVNAGEEGVAKQAVAGHAGTAETGETAR